MDRDYTPDTREIESPAKEINREAKPREKRPERQERYSITDREQGTLYEVGRFRTIAVEDLVNHRYDGKGSELRADLRSLLAQGLVERRTAFVAQGRHKLAVLVLTKAGRKVAEAKRADPEQSVYSGFVKPGEVAHDAAIYRMFHKEAAHITSQGGTIKRIVLDYELKNEIYSPLAKARGQAPLEYARRQAEIARENSLKIVNGKIPLPDLRIEYETAEGEMTRVDLELATHHYHGSHLQIKAEAGFKIYGDSSVAHRSPVVDGHQIKADILSL